MSKSKQWKWHDAAEPPPRPNMYLVAGTFLPTKTSGMMTCRWNGEKWDAPLQIRVTDWTELPPPPGRDVYKPRENVSPCRDCRRKATCFSPCKSKKDWDRHRQNTARQERLAQREKRKKEIKP